MRDFDADRAAALTVPCRSCRADMLISAVRYALGRRTYIVGMTVDEVVRSWPELSDKTRAVILRDISQQRELHARMDFGALSREWNAVTRLADA